MTVCVETIGKQPNFGTIKGYTLQLFMYSGHCQVLP